mmetsp:Transcript_29947/g.59384  ORF Transcript_29947/g.59384 Transcript_29947/m.59384 type:complete len:202 (-) Transcript_29947:2365-2970(-)
MFTQLPVPVVNRRHRPCPHHALELKPRKLSHLSHRALHRSLNLCQRRDRHPDWQIIIQHVVFTQIGMGQDKIAEALRVPQTGTVSHHDPGVWTQHCNVVCGRLGIGRPHTNIHQSDTGPIFSLQVIGRHLRLFIHRRNRRLSIRDLHVTSADKTGVARLGIIQHLARVSLKLSHIKLVVGEQHVVLKMLRISSRVVAQPSK